MEVLGLSNAGQRKIPNRGARKGDRLPLTQHRSPSPLEADKEKVRVALKKIIRNTRFQYILKDEFDYFVVRIIDKDTDKVIREIPSKELQKLHEGFDESLGFLFNKEI